MGLLDEHRRQLLRGDAYTDPGAVPRTHFGQRLVIQSQSCEDRTVEFLVRQLAEVGKRLVVAEARLSILEALSREDL